MPASSSPTGKGQLGSFYIDMPNNEIKHEPYDWKPKPKGTSQNSLLEKLLEKDQVKIVWDFLVLRDVFALTFVSHWTRCHTIKKAMAIRYVTQRGRGILMKILMETVKNKTHKFLEMMRDHKLYVGGSSILHGILYEHPSEVPWSGDLDVYAPSDAGFKMMKPKMDKMFTLDRERDDDYGSWFYGSWMATHDFGGNVRGSHKIDVISADNGIECYDLTICQNSISWDGRMRSFNIADIVYQEMRISRLYETHLKSMITFSITNCVDNIHHHRYLLKNLYNMVHNNMSRIGKYSARGFLLCTNISKYFSSLPNLQAEFNNMRDFEYMDVSDMDPAFAMIVEARFKEYGLIKSDGFFVWRQDQYHQRPGKKMPDDRDTILIDEPPISVGFIVEYINLLMLSANSTRM